MKLSNYTVGQLSARRKDEIYVDMLSAQAQEAVRNSGIVDMNIVSCVFPIAFVACDVSTMDQQAIDDEAMVQSGVYGLAC